MITFTRPRPSKFFSEVSRVTLFSFLSLPRPRTLCANLLILGCHDNGYVTTLNSYITSGHEQKLILLPGYSDVAAEIEKLGLPSLKIPSLFLAEKLSAPLVQHATDADRIPTPPTSPPGLVHPSSVARQSVGSYKSAVQTKTLADDAKWNVSSIRVSAEPPQLDNFDSSVRGLRKTNPRLVEFTDSLIIRYGNETDDPPLDIAAPYEA